MSTEMSESMENSSSPSPWRLNLAGITGFALAISTVVFVIMLGGHPELFLNVPALVVVVGLTTAIGLMAYGTRDLARALFAMRVVVARLPVGLLRHRDADVLRGLTVYVYASGIIGSSIGIIQILATLDDPSTLYPAVAVASLPVFYAVLASEGLLRPAARLIERRPLACDRRKNLHAPLTPHGTRRR